VKLQRPVALIADAAELPADELAQIAFEVQREIARRVRYAGQRLPQHLI